MLVGIEQDNAVAVNPESCRLVGKECRDCVSSSAAIVAMLCPDLDAVGAQQLFFRMYRHIGCGGMARSFVREYLGAAEPEIVEARPTLPLFQIAACA